MTKKKNNRNLIRIFIFWIVLISMIFIIGMAIFIKSLENHYDSKIFAFNIEDYNLKDYFGDYNLGERKNKIWNYGGFNMSLSYEWKVTFNNYNGKSVTHKLINDTDFDYAIQRISFEMLQQEIRDIIIKKDNSYQDELGHKIGVSITHIEGYDLEPDMDEKFLPKNINYATFSAQKEYIKYKIYLWNDNKDISDTKVAEFANELMAASNSPINLDIYVNNFWGSNPILQSKYRQNKVVDINID